jgi:hypothetical protein
MGEREKLYRHLQEAYAKARHPLARANIARLLKTFEHWFHLNLEDGTSDAMVQGAKLGRHVRYSSFTHGNTPMPVTYMTLESEAPRESETLISVGNAQKTSLKGWTFRMRIKPIGAAAKDGFPVPSLSMGGLPGAVAPTLDDAGDGDFWSPPVAPERQKDGSYLYTVRLEKKAGSSFDPAQFSLIRFEYPLLAWREPSGYKPEFAVYDMQLTDPAGKRFVDPTLAERQGNLARKHYFEGGELGDQ